MRLDSELEISRRPHGLLLNGRLSSERLSDGRAPPTGDGSDMSDVVVARVEALVSAAAPLRRALAKVAGRLRFGLGLREGRPPLAEYTSGDWVAGLVG